MPDDIALLSQVPLFKALPEAELRRLASTLRLRLVAAGTPLFLEGEPGDHFYVVRSGQIEVLKALGTPDETLIDLRGAGEFIGETSLVSPERQRTATVRAHGPIEVWEMTRADFDDLLHRHPLLAYEMLRVLSERLSKSHNRALHDLQEKNRELTVAYQELQGLQAQLIESEKVERELELARGIQMSLLPQRAPLVPGYNLGARMAPARAVGGDFFDFVELGEGRLGLVIGDATDKGVPAALFVAQARALLRAEASRGSPPAEVLARVNHLLLGINDTELFVTILYGVLDPATGEFTYARAGHEPPLFCGPEGAAARLPFSRGNPLGILPRPALDLQTVRLLPGSRMLLYSDGAPDMRDEQGQAFGEERLRQAFQAFPHADAQSLCDGILALVTDYRGAAPQYDDVTLLALECLSSP